MRTVPPIFISAVVVALAGSVFSRADTNSIPPISPGFLKTNGEYVTIGNVMVQTNSPLNTDDFKEYMWRVYQLNQLLVSGATNATDEFVAGAWKLAKDYPDRPNGYQFIMEAIEVDEYKGQPDKAKALAKELAGSSAPERFKLWAKGVQNRLDSLGKPVSMEFTAVDGRPVDLADMREKVVLVDFWGTDCGPCVAELPAVKEAYDKFHAQGFEVIGISCDTDKAKLERFVKEKGYPWPQYFDGHDQESNKFAQEFGIDSIPHMFLVDKKGVLRFDGVRATDRYRLKGDNLGFQEKISKLLAEN